ncbi:MAG: hypothetical protein EHM20_05300 [Alphaproteobacteria bacterium]|nr:MAG: hypothetical protein EHM20_05300 [Alphaproteobacteria bacterium]
MLTREEIVDISGIVAISTVVVVGLFLVFYWLGKRINKAAKCKKGYKKEDALLIGLSLGMSFGLIMGNLMHNLATGISLGVAIGMSLGVLIGEDNENKR